MLKIIGIVFIAIGVVMLIAILIVGKKNRISEAKKEYKLLSTLGYTELYKSEEKKERPNYYQESIKEKAPAKISPEMEKMFEEVKSERAKEMTEYRKLTPEEHTMVLDEADKSKNSKGTAVLKSDDAGDARKMSKTELLTPMQGTAVLGDDSSNGTAVLDNNTAVLEDKNPISQKDSTAVLGSTAGSTAILDPGAADSRKIREKTDILDASISPGTAVLDTPNEPAAETRKIRNEEIPESNTDKPNHGDNTCVLGGPNELIMPASETRKTSGTAVLGEEQNIGTAVLDPGAEETRKIRNEENEGQKITTPKHSENTEVLGPVDIPNEPEAETRKISQTAVLDNSLDNNSDEEGANSQDQILASDDAAHTRKISGTAILDNGEERLINEEEAKLLNQIREMRDAAYTRKTSGTEVLHESNGTAILPEPKPALDETEGKPEESLPIDYTEEETRKMRKSEGTAVLGDSEEIHILREREDETIEKLQELIKSMHQC